MIWMSGSKGKRRMGCLFELLFEFVFELIVELVGTVYIRLMTLFVPEHQFNKSLKKRIENGVEVFAVLLLLCAIIGFFMFLQPPYAVKIAGAYLLFIPLGIIVIQIIAGIIYRIVRARGRHRWQELSMFDRYLNFYADVR